MYGLVAESAVPLSVGGIINTMAATERNEDRPCSDYMEDKRHRKVIMVFQVRGGSHSRSSDGSTLTRHL